VKDCAGVLIIEIAGLVGRLLVGGREQVEQSIGGTSKPTIGKMSITQTSRHARPRNTKIIPAITVIIVVFRFRDGDGRVETPESTEPHFEQNLAVSRFCVPQLSQNIVESPIFKSSQCCCRQ
jgi:hypothetical protein